MALFGVVAGAAYVVDVVSKVVAVDRLEPDSRIPVVGDLLQLTLVRNPGAAFSTGTSFTLLLSCIAIGAAIAVLWFARRLVDRFWAVGLGLLLAGVLGNLTDRLLRAPGPLRGEVIDFLRLPNWPVFNVADMCINAAAAIILIQAFRGIHLDGTWDADHRDAETDPNAETGSDAETDPDAEPDPEAGLGTDAGSGPDTGGDRG